MCWPILTFQIWDLLKSSPPIHANVVLQGEDVARPSVIRNVDIAQTLTMIHMN